MTLLKSSHRNTYNDKTLTDKSNRYIGSMFFKNNIIGVAFLDSSTGEFHMANAIRETFNNLLLKFSPQEVVLSKRLFILIHCGLGIQTFYKVDDWLFDFENAYEFLFPALKSNR